MQTQSTCYKGTTIMTPKGVLWHSTGANNPTLKRYVQPSDVRPKEDNYSKEEWLKILGENQYGNDWNHITKKAGLNAWIGKLADGTVASIQTMPLNYAPWGCGKGSKGSCNDGWIQFEICEDDLSGKNYFNAVYKEACELTAYICKLYNINPKGTATLNGVTVPTILCHQDAYKLKLGSNHSDIYHWFKKYGKTMDDVRNDVAALLDECPEPAVVKTYELYVSVPTYSSAGDAKAKKNQKGTYKPGIYYIYNKYPNGVDGMLNISTDKTGKSAGSWINPSENVIKESASTPAPVVTPVNTEQPKKQVAENRVLEWQKAAIADGFKFASGADGKWGKECEAVAKQAICKKRVTYKYKSLTKLVQKAVGVKADGKFGNNTKAAVVIYQKSNGLIADGCVGLNTWKKILNI